MTLSFRPVVTATLAAALAAFSLPGCSSDSDSKEPTGSGGSQGTGGDGSGGGETVEDTEPTADDFKCLTDGTQVKSFYVSNRFGESTDAAVAVANDPNGGTYPVGTIIQLLPGEAMVKRHAGFSADTSDWEFFFLKVTASGAEIQNHGTTDVLNAFKLNCLDCHKKADSRFDMVCGKDHGCDPLPFTDDQITTLQGTDARCAAK